MIVIAVLLSVVLGLILSVRIYTVARKSGNTTSQSHAILSGAMILGVGVMLGAYFLLKGEGWTEDNKVDFYQIGVISLTIGFVIFGLRLVLSGRKQGSWLTAIVGAGWVIGALFLGYSSYVFAGKINDGWSVEKKARVVAKCDPTTTNCQCFLKKTIEYFDSVEDYTETLSDETGNKDKIDAYYAILDTACACGNVGNDVEEVDLPF